MTIAGDGNVGIGTTAPQANLHIYNPTITTSGDTTNGLPSNTNTAKGPTEVLRLQGKHAFGPGSGAFIRFTNYLSTSNPPKEYNLAGIGAIDTTDNYGGSLGFYTTVRTGSAQNLTLRMIVNNDGNVGIGTDNPITKLDIDNREEHV